MVAALIAAGGGALAWKVRAELAVRSDAAEARRLVEAGRIEEARGPLLRWVQARPKSGEAAFLLARATIGLGMVDQGLALLDRAEALGFPPSASRRLRGLTLARAGDLRGASASLERVVAAAEGPDPEVDQALARCYLETFQLGAALGAIERWARDAPGDPRPYLWKADVGRRSGAEGPTLIDAYRAALRIDPGSPEALKGLGEQLVEAHGVDEARPLFEACLARRPDDPDALLGLGRCLAEQGDLDAACPPLDRAATLAPRDARPPLERARVEARRGRPGDALAWADRALAIDPAEGDAHSARANALVVLGRRDEAVEARRSAERFVREKEEIRQILDTLNASPNDLALQFRAAKWLFDHDHPEEGRRWAETILRQRPGHADANRLLAAYHERRGEAGLARAYLLRAEASGPAESAVRLRIP